MTRALLLLCLLFGVYALLTGCGPSPETFKGCAHHSTNRTDGDLRDCGEKS